MPDPQPLDELTCAAFARHEGDDFTADSEDGDRRALRLLAADPATSAADGRRAPFSLLFGCDDPVPLGQRIVGVEHPVLGRLDLFLVPIGPGNGHAMRYEAIFN